MALLTNRKFIHFNQKSSFDTALANEQIANWQIVFIKDARLIWTHGQYYSFDQRITNDIYHKLLALNEINVELVSQVDALQQTVYSFFLSGATANRPDDMELGIAFFDTDLDKPIWWDGTKWIDSEGNPADARHSGTTAQRPTGVKAGFMYYDTTIGKVLNYNGTSWIETGLTETEVENIVKYNSKEVEEYNGTSSFPPTGEDGIVYVDTSTTPPTYYTWNGTTYVPNSNAINQVDWNENDTTSSQYIKNKPSSLPASDVYDWAKAATKPSYNYSEIGNTPTLGTAAAKDVPTSGNASTTQVVMGDDTRLTDSRSASDVYSWAKAENKPTYTKSEVGLSNVTNDAQVKRSEMGAANGVATLGSDGKVPSSQLPSYVDDVIEGYYYNSKFYKEAAHTTLITGESDKIYVDLSSDKTYRCSNVTNQTYTQIKGDLALGETSSTAYRGDRGKIAYDHSQSTHARTDATKTEASETNGNIKINGTDTTVYTHPTTTAVNAAAVKVGKDSAGHVVIGDALTKSDVGLGNVANKTITITNSSVSDGTNTFNKYVHPGSGTNPHGTTKSDVGLGNVGNFKAVSTEASQGLSNTEKSNARANIGAGTSSFSGSYTDLTNKPTIPAAQIQSDWDQTTTTAKDYIKNKPTIITNQAILDLFGGSSIDPSENPNIITSNDVVSISKNGIVPKTTAAVKYLQTNSQGVASWGDKPNYDYGEINYLSNDSTDYTINNSSATLSIDGTQPLQVVTTTTNIAGITFSALPANGHSCHLLITAASALTVDIAHDATMITVESTAYKTVCPKAAAMDTLNITAGGYVELDLLRVGTKIYVRGV